MGNHKRIKKMLITIISIIISITTIGTVVFAADPIGYIEYWESSPETSIRKHLWTPYVYFESLAPGHISTTQFRAYGSIAVYDWNIGGTPCIKTDTEAGSEIRMYAGEYYDCKEKIPGWQLGWVGASYVPDYGVTYYGYYLLGQSRKNCYVYNMLVKAAIDVNEYNYMVHAIKHELGHSLGWRGHSSRTTDIMYGYEHGAYYLTTYDKRHTAQIH